MTPQLINSANMPPGTLGLPILGETVSFILNSNFAEERFKKFGSIFKTSIFGKPTIFVRGGKAVQFIVMNENKFFSNNLPSSTQSLVGSHSLSMQVGTKHQNRRRQIYQAFSPRLLSSYSNTIDKITQDYLEKWAIAKSLIWYPEIRKYTFDVACKFLVGVDNASETLLGKLFETWSEGLFSFAPPFRWTKLGIALDSRSKILLEFDKLIFERRDKEEERNDALSILLQAKDENGKNLDPEEIKDQLLTLLFAGHETLTSAIASFCLNVGLNPSILEQCRQEQDSIGYFDVITQELLDRMTYLEKVLFEVLRHNPPVGGGFKKVDEACEFEGYIFPKGWNVFYLINATHHNKDIYSSPEEFNPDRLNNVQSNDVARTLDYVPFGGGMRECIGKEFARQEMKIFAAQLIRNYSWTLEPSQNLEMVLRPVPYPKDRLIVSFSRLQN